MKNLISVPYEIWNGIDDGSLALNTNYELIEQNALSLKEEILSLKNSVYSDDTCSELTARCNVIYELASGGYQKVCGFNDYLLSVFTYQSDDEN